MNKENEHLKQQIGMLPDNPGVYQYFDKEGKLLYIGKAKNLKKRVSSYFVKTQQSAKTTTMVRQITDIRFIVVETEYDALLLENNLIKNHQPKYNVSLKDDKTYPWIIIKNEPFPRVFYTRKLIKDGSQYFGPYASGMVMHTLLDLIKDIYKLRNCSLNLSKENIEAGKFRVCLEYHIGNCKGPCAGLQDKAEYDDDIAGIREILKGNINGVMQQLEQNMKFYAAAFEYEKAQQYKEKIEILEQYKSKTVIVNPAIHDVDVFSMMQDDDIAYINYMKVMSGAVIQSHTIEVKRKLEELPEELLSMAIINLRERYHSKAKEILVPFLPDVEIPEALCTIPKIGDKKKLLDLSLKNVLYFRKNKLDQQDLLNPEHRVERLMTQMQNDLRLPAKPYHIECFDNSNIQGTNAVAAMSVFKNGRPSKNDYRHFNIKTVEGPDDFASMEEVIYRRYKRMLDEQIELPQLIVIDGGKGQLSAALNSLERLGLRGKISIIGIAKKLEEIYFPGDSLPLYLDKKSETLKIIQQLRDEVHRFGIAHHRNKRSKSTIKTGLTDVKGIGPATAEILLNHFRSVKRIRESSTDELEKIIGKAKTKILLEFFQQNKT